MGKGIYGMKPLGGGHLIGQVEESFNFVKKTSPLFILLLLVCNQKKR